MALARVYCTIRNGYLAVTSLQSELMRVGAVVDVAASPGYADCVALWFPVFRFPVFRQVSPMHFARCILFAVLVFLPPTLATAQYSDRPSGPGIDQLCKECGVIYEIRRLTSEREFAKTLEERTPEAGPIINIPLGRNPNAKPQIGVYGSREMREQMQEHVYEVVIRFDDGRFTRIEVSDISDLSIGARVRVYQNRIERYDR